MTPQLYQRGQLNVGGERRVLVITLCVDDLRLTPLRKNMDCVHFKLMVDRRLTTNQIASYIIMVTMKLA